MKLKRLRQDDVEINLISLIDVLLFLVIFFMVSTTFVAKSQLSLTLPEAPTNEESNREKAIHTSSGGDGFGCGAPLAPPQHLDCNPRTR